MNRRQRVQLSKLMSVALRHRPQDFNLTLNDNGWVALDALVAAIATRPKWHWIGIEAVRQVIETSDKQRFEVDGPLVRARYGHSRAVRPAYRPVEPPAVLYHGTPRHNLAAIRHSGLKAMNRQYVHLSATPEMALQVGRRRDATPALLVIRAADAYSTGIIFGTPSGHQDDVYLVETIPAEFIEFPQS